MWIVPAYARKSGKRGEEPVCHAYLNREKPLIPSAYTEIDKTLKALRISEHKKNELAKRKIFADLT